jgi:dTDP-4-amino-4,6-dideoxygalactose transaminase
MTSERLASAGGTPVRTRPFGPTHDFGEEDIHALADVIRSGTIGSRKVREFERTFAAKVGTQFAAAVNSGTSAMHTCVGAINPDPGSEIIVSPWTSGGSLMGVLLHNCVPVFADIDETYNIDPRDVEARITARTRAIIAVHLFGNPCDMGALRDIARRHQLFLIEDCCQAHFSAWQGTTVGTLGDIAGFSFGGKHLSAGMGGAVLTNNLQLFERAMMFADAALPRPHNAFAKMPYANYFLAPNYRINDLIAAVLLTQLDKVDGYIERKIRAAERITAGLSDAPEIVPQVVRPGDRNTYWMYGFTIDRRALGVDAREFAAMVTEEGVPMGGPYVGSGSEGPLFRNPFLAEPNCYGKSRFPFDYARDKPYDYRLTRLPFGEELMARSCSLQMRPSLTDGDVDDVVEAITKVVGHCRVEQERSRPRVPVGAGR